MSTYLGFSILILFLTIVVSVYFFCSRRMQKNIERQMEILGNERKELIEILGCSHYGVGRLIRQLREHHQEQVTNFSIIPESNRLELDLKTDILLSKLALWGNHHNVLGSFDMANVHRVPTSVYELQAIKCHRGNDTEHYTNLLYRINDQSKLMRRASSIAYTALRQAK